MEKVKGYVIRCRQIDAFRMDVTVYRPDSDEADAIKELMRHINAHPDFYVERTVVVERVERL